MKTIFITGDRAMSNLLAAQLVDKVLNEQIEVTGGDMAVGTGNCMAGVERAVRFLIPEEACNIAPYSFDEDGDIDFETTFRHLEPSTDEVIFIHMDPLSSHIGKALAKTFPPEKIRMYLQESALSL